MRETILRIITKHTVNVNSFIDGNGKNMLPELVEELHEYVSTAPIKPL